MDQALDKLLNKVLLGDIREVCIYIPDQFVQSIITSPPYFGHRKYSKIDNEIGREKTLNKYVNNLVSSENGKNAGNQNLHDGRWDQAFHPKGRNKRTVWEIPLGKFRDVHFAVYPEKLVEICLLASTKQNDVVLDPFTGSGTTGVVAKKHNRSFIGIELVEKYQIMAQNRIDETTFQETIFLLLKRSELDVQVFTISVKKYYFWQK